MSTATMTAPAAATATGTTPAPARRISAAETKYINLCARRDKALAAFNDLYQQAQASWVELVALRNGGTTSR